MLGLAPDELILAELGLQLDTMVSLDLGIRLPLSFHFVCKIHQGGLS